MVSLLTRQELAYRELEATNFLLSSECDPSLEIPINPLHTSLDGKLTHYRTICLLLTGWSYSELFILDR